MEYTSAEAKEKLARDMYEIKMARRYGKKRVRLDEAFRKTMHQRRNMKKKPEVVEVDSTQKKLSDAGVLV